MKLKEEGRKAESPCTLTMGDRPWELKVQVGPTVREGLGYGTGDMM